MSVGQAIQFSNRFETMMKSYTRGKYDLLGRFDFQPGFAAFDHDYKPFIFLRLSCHQQQYYNAVCHATILARVTTELSTSLSVHSVELGY